MPFFISKKSLDRQIKLEVEKASKSTIEDIQSPNQPYVDRPLKLTYEDMWNMYMRCEWVRACVDKITKSVTAVKLFAAPKDETQKDSEQVKLHIDQVNALLDDPNDGLDSFSDIRREYMRDVLVYDAGALELVYDKETEVAEIYSLPGSKIRLNVDEHGNFKSEDEAYYEVSKDEYKKGGIPFARKELIYLVANPKSGSVYGLSPLESLYFSVMNDLNASKYNADFFGNNGEASGILGIENINFTELQRFRNYWKKEIQGKPHKMALVNGKPTWTPMNVSNRDMQFLEYQKWLLMKIMAVYGMQPLILGVVDPSTGKLNSEQQLEVYKNETIKPLLSMECYQLTKVLVQQGFQFDDVVIKHEPIDAKDDMANTDIAVRLKSSGIISVNEARTIYLGLETKEGADELKVDGPTNSFGQEVVRPEAKEEGADA